VTADLMTLSIHSLDNVDPSGIRIDSAMAIVSANKECGLHAILCQSVEDLSSVDVGPIVERDSDSARFLTRNNASTAVGYGSLLRTWVVARA
jgi:hypothetical protein